MLKTFMANNRTLHDCGRYIFERFSESDPLYTKWLGTFNPGMSSEEANRLLDHVGKISEEGQREFMQGWAEAQNNWTEKQETQNVEQTNQR